MRNPPEPQEPPLRLPPAPPPKPPRVISWRRVALYFFWMSVAVLAIVIVTLPIFPLWFVRLPDSERARQRECWDGLKRAAWDLAE